MGGFAENEGPRERARRLGLSALSDAEIVALLLGTGTRGCSVMDLAQDVLSTVGGVTKLAEASFATLYRHGGLGFVKATRLAAGIELGRRALLASSPTAVVVREAQDLAAVVVPRLVGLQREVFLSVLLNAKNAVIDVVPVARGTVDACSLHPRDVFRVAIERNASSLILVHNHPSGNPLPSVEDLNLTRRLRKGGDTLGIRILDHLIVAHQQLVSLREQGHWAS